MPADANAFFVNGAPVSDQGKWYFVPEQDAVQEVQASANPYDAQYGRTAGGAFNANVKAGTSKFHGSIYDVYGNKVLNSNYFTDDLFDIAKAVNTRNTFGGTVGGPIFHGKTYFFGAYEGFRQNTPSPALDSVPPMAWRTGNFQGSGYTIYDPATTTCVATNSSGGCTQYGRQPFMNDMIPNGRISAIGQAILAMYPQPTAAGNVNNYAISVPAPSLMINTSDASTKPSPTKLACMAFIPDRRMAGLQAPATAFRIKPVQNSMQPASITTSF